MKTLLCSPWTSTDQDKSLQSLQRIVSGRFLPTIYSLAGLDMKGRDDDAPNPGLEGVLSRSGKAGKTWSLVLSLGDQQSPAQKNPIKTASQLFNAFHKALAELGLLSDFSNTGMQVAENWIRCFGSLPLTELDTLCECFEDLELFSTGSTEVKTRLAGRLAASREDTLRNVFLRIALGERQGARPIFARSLTLLGLCLGDYGLAEQGYVALKENGAGADPTLQARIALELAQARFEREHLDGYYALINQAQNLAPEDPVVLRQVATACLVKNKPKESLEIWESLLNKQPLNPNYLFGQAQALEGLKKQEEAQATYQKILEQLGAKELDDESEALLSAVLGPITAGLVAAHEHDAVLQLAAHYAPIFGKHPALINVLASSLIMIHKYDHAGRLLDQSLIVDPDNALSLALKGRTLLALGHPKDAVSLIRKASTTDPNSQLWTIALAEALVEAEELEEASVIFKELAEQEGGAVASGTFMVLVARKHEDNGDTEKAEEWYRTAVGAYSDSHFTRSEYGAFLIQQARVSEAADLLSTLLEIAPGYLGGIKNLQSALLILLKSPATAKLDKERTQALLLRVNTLLANAT
jgi:tetratricopeptide (TPR) repeat protein